MSRLKTILTSGLITSGLVVLAMTSPNIALAAAETNPAKSDATFVRPLDTIQNGKARKFVVEMDGYVPPTNWLPQIKGGKATITAEVYPDHYKIITRASVAGILDWFIDYSSTLTSDGEVTEKGLQPRFYRAKDDEGRKNRVTEIKHTDDFVEVEVVPAHGNLGDPAATMEQKLEAMDPISALLQLAIAPEAVPGKPCSGVAKVFDGKARYNLHLEEGTHVESIESEAWNGPAYICSVRYEELAGYKKKSAAQRAKEAKDLRWVSMTLADMGPGELRVPIKIEARSNKRGKITVVASELKYEHLDTDHADATKQASPDHG
ncbi:DUF3108 domain-containing protein [Hirschia litorea]|uniref:DUF3108 domain-containing protein n=1 Tax=Hirschia litorea TaxID=1199156 RepID=A0ABW2IJM2_9PROT